MKRLLVLAFVLLSSLAGFAQAQSLTASPATVYSSQSVTADWSGIATPTATDWIGLYAPGAADTAFISFIYTNGAAAGSLPFGIPANLAGGTYELRLFANNGYTLLATSGAITVNTPPPATLSASPSSVMAGASLTAGWTDIFAPTASDWIGLYAPGAADNAFISFIYTNGAAAGSLPFGIPLNLAAGTYELRLFANNGYTLLATSGAITVTTPPPATLSASPSSVLAGSSLTAAWTNIFSPTASDWVGLYPAGAADTAFINFYYTNGAAAGSLPFGIPLNLATGTYELRLFANNGYTLLATSGAITITAPPPVTLSVTPASVAPGGSVTAAWTNIVAPTGTDWIGLYAPGAADNAFISWQYTSGAAAGNVPFAIAASVAPGSYQLRLFSNNGYTRLATSTNFSVGLTKLFYIHPDHLNTPRLVADSTGTTVWRNDSTEPFGNNPPDENPSGLGVFPFPLRESDYFHDTETNQRYAMLRDCYDPATGRFCQPDPVGVAGLALASGQIPGIEVFAARWFATRPVAGSTHSSVVMSWPYVELPMVDDLPRWSGASLYSYVDGNPLRLTDFFGLNPGDKWYGFNDPNFRDYVHGVKQEMNLPKGFQFDKQEITNLHKCWEEEGRPRGKGGKSGKGGKQRDWKRFGGRGGFGGSNE